jgi:hypothetical protein
VIAGPAGTEQRVMAPSRCSSRTPPGSHGTSR